MKSMHNTLSFVSTSASAGERAATLTVLAASDMLQVTGGGTMEGWGLRTTPPVVYKPAA